MGTIQLNIVAQKIVDYAKERKERHLPASEILDSLMIKYSLQLSESRLQDTLLEMKNAGLVKDMDVQTRLIHFDEGIFDRLAA